jgi:hypothetical protein
MRRSFAVLVFSAFAASVTALACDDKESRPPAVNAVGPPSTGVGGGGGGGGDGGGGEGGVDSGNGAAACNILENGGNVVDQNRIVGEPPTGTGGTIVDGTYELTAADVYVGAGGVPGPSGVTYQGALALATGKLERVMLMQASQAATPIETRSLGDLIAGGTTFTVTQTCPAPFQDQYTYSVLNNTLNITSLITKESFTFTLR